MKKLFAHITIIGLLLLAGCKEPPAPLATANFYVGNSGCIAPCQVQFYDQSENAVKWEWDFGNGNSSVLQNDSCLYEASGTYEVWLHVWNIDDAKESVRKTITVNE